MNKNWANIPLLLLLSGCALFNNNNRTDSKGENISKNAPIFISPKTNAVPVNKGGPNMNENPVNKPPTVKYEAENYLLIKEKDLNKVAAQKTNEILLNIKKLNANEKEPNKSLDAAIDSEIKKIEALPQLNLTEKTIKLEDATEKEKERGPIVHPFFSFVLTVAVVLGFTLTVGYFFFVKKKRSNETPTATEREKPSA
jgi:hypothetical protein